MSVDHISKANSHKKVKGERPNYIIEINQEMRQSYLECFKLATPLSTGHV